MASRKTYICLILNKLFDSPDGLTFHELVKRIPEQLETMQHLDVLLKNNIVEEKDGKYFLSKKGLDFYYALGNAAMKVKEEGLLSRSPSRQNL